MRTPFGRLESDLSTRFTGLPVEEVDGEIERALRLLVELLGTDRSTFSLIATDGRLVQTHSWAREGVEPASPAVTGGAPWYGARLAAGHVIALSRLPDDLPEDAEWERAYVRASGMRSVLTVPVAVGGRYVCTLSTGAFRDYRTWDEEAVDHVRLVGQIIANAVHRKRTEEQLRQQLDEIRALKDQLQEENVYLREEARGGDFADVVGQSPALGRVLERVSQVAPTSSSVLLLGETGTGKELLAQAIHERSPRKARAFIKVNCAALPASLIETELLGHERGAFTGAIAAHPGRFELADGGTLFLDEIGDLAVELQSKLLRVLQDGEVQRLGATRSRKVDVRLVAATNQDLERAMAEGRFRRDLYYRLSVFPIHDPAPARAPGRHPADHLGLRRAATEGPGPAHRADPPGRHGRARRLRLAGQRARARERARAGPHPLAGQGAAARRPAARPGPERPAAPTAAAAPAAADRQLRRRWPASTCARCSSAARGGSTGRAARRRCWRSTPTPCAHA